MVSRLVDLDGGRQLAVLDPQGRRSGGRQEGEEERTSCGDGRCSSMCPESWRRPFVRGKQQFWLVLGVMTPFWW